MGVDLDDEYDVEKLAEPVVIPSSKGPHIYKWADVWTISLLGVIVLFLFADQNLLSPNLSAVAEEFGFNDKQKDKKLGGDINLAFFGFGGPASLLVGYLADVMNRRYLLLLVVVVGEAGALGTAGVTTYVQLYWLRALTGVAIGGALPLIFSIIGDLVPPSARAHAAGWMGVAVTAGQGVGQLVAARYGTGTGLAWRLPFLLVAVPCLVLSALFVATTHDPPRGGQEQGLSAHIGKGGSYSEKISWKSLRLLASSKTVLLIFLQGAPGTVPWGIIGTYLSDFLYKQRGLTVEGAALVTFLFQIGGGVGIFMGGPFGQWLYNRDKRLHPLWMGLTTIAGIGPAVALVEYQGGKEFVYWVASFLAGFLASITGPNIRSILLNVTVPVTRGTAFGIYNLVADVGRGMGIYLISLLIAGLGRHRAFLWGFQFWVLCGICIMLIACTVVKDEASVQGHLRLYAEEYITRISELDAEDPRAPVDGALLPKSKQTAARRPSKQDPSMPAYTAILD